MTFCSFIGHITKIFYELIECQEYLIKMGHPNCRNNEAHNIMVLQEHWLLPDRQVIQLGS